MSGIADAIKLREYTNVHPQIQIQEVGTFKSPRTGRTVDGLYVGQVGRIHPEDPTKPIARLTFDLSFPDMTEIEPFQIGPWNPFETTYNWDFPSNIDPIDKRYTPTTHKAPLPVGAKFPPSLAVVNPHLVKAGQEANNSVDWNLVTKKFF